MYFNFSRQLFLQLHYYYSSHNYLQQCIYNYILLYGISIVSLLFYTHAHRHVIYVRCKKSSDNKTTTKDNTFFFLTFSDKCALQTRAFLTIISVQSARFVLFRATAVIVLFWSGSGSRYALKFQIGASTTSI